MATGAEDTKGCNTCRRRKKGCDLNRPYCFRCLKERRVCEGYERATVFVRHAPVTSAGHTRLRQFRSKPDHRTQSPRADSSKPGAIVLHASLARSAFGEQCASLWWDVYVPKSHSVLPAPTSQKPWSTAWADTITRLSTNSTVLRKALYALSLSCTGCQRQDEKLAREGQIYYSQALVQLGQILHNPELAAEDESLLPACLQLVDYEFFNGFCLPEHYRRAGNWQVHVEGINRLLQLKGRGKYQTTDALLVFQAYRKMQLALSFSRSHKFRSSNPSNWSDVPTFDENVSPKEKLRNILTPVPQLLAGAYDTQPRPFEERRQAFQGLNVVYQRLHSWKGALNFQLFGSDLDQGPDLLMACGTDVVDAVLLYWSMCIAMYTAVEKLEIDLSLDDINALIHRSEILPDKDATKENVLKFANFLLRPDGGLAGVLNVCLPIGILVRYGIAHDENLTEEIESVIDTLVEHVSSGPLGRIIETLLRRVCYRSATL